MPHQVLHRAALQVRITHSCLDDYAAEKAANYVDFVIKHRVAKGSVRPPRLLILEGPPSGTNGAVFLTSLR